MLHPRTRRALRTLASVRVRAGMVVLLAVLPLIGLMIGRALVERNTVLQAAELRALDTARLLAERQNAASQEMTSLLALAGRLLAIRTLDAPQCNRDLEAVTAGRTNQLVLWASNAAGRLTCSSLPDGLGLDVSQEASFMRLMAADGPQRLQTFIARGRLRNVALIVSQVPMFDTAGRRVGVLSAALPFSWLTEVAHALDKWVQDPIFLIDVETGQILARSVQPESWVGQRFPDHPVLRAYRAAPQPGMTEAINPRGVDQVFGYAPLQDTGGRRTLLVVALGRSELLAAVDLQLGISIAVAVALGLLSIACAWWAAHLSLMRPIRQLLVQARHLGGQAHLHVVLSPWHAPELRLLEARLRARGRRLAAARAAQAASEAQLRLLAESTSDVIIRLDHALRVLYVSPAVREVLGCSPAEFAATDRAEAIHPDDLAQVQAHMAELVATGSDNACTYRRRGARGWVWLETTSRLAADGVGFVCVMRDVTLRRQVDERIRHMAHHDGLTGLANRTELRRQLHAMLQRAAAGGEPVRVLCVDLDRFKQVNDQLGHLVGDELLRRVGERLRAFVEGAPEGLAWLPPPEAGEPEALDSAPGAPAWPAACPRRLAARLGGDEFALALSGDLPEAALATELHRLLELLGRPVRIGSHELQIGASIGVAQHPQHGATVTDLLRNADAALYRVKQAGAGGFALFNPSLASEQHRRRQLEHDLRLAMAAGQLRLVFQPVVEARSLEVVAVEALLRWQHPTLGAITPTEFIRVAEESGLIEAIGLWVLRTACAEAASWPRGWTVAVNLSPVQVQREGLPEQVARILAETGLPSRRLKLEITEGILIGDEERARAMMRALQAQGVSMALDDFGTGYASLTTLSGLAFDTLKIDRSLVQGVASQPQQAIIRAMLDLAEALDMDVIAEGVETVEQLEQLRRMGCPKLQGYLLGRPVPAGELLASHHVTARRLDVEPVG